MKLYYQTEAYRFTTRMPGLDAFFPLLAEAQNTGVSPLQMTLKPVALAILDLGEKRIEKQNHRGQADVLWATSTANLGHSNLLLTEWIKGSLSDLMASWLGSLMIPAIRQGHLE